MGQGCGHMPGQAQAWVLLIYTMPREPTAPRVAVWRKLKKLGALRLHDAAWVLPATPALLEQVRWLAAEIREGQGEALVWHTQGDTPEQDESLIAQLVTPAELGYQAILTALDRPEADHAELARRYRQILATIIFTPHLARWCVPAWPVWQEVQLEMGHLDRGGRGSHGLRLAHSPLARPRCAIRLRP